jgi:serine/threonine protein phosphatase PrpC
MRKHLQVSTGQYSSKGTKPINQDLHGIFIPNEPLLSSKGIAVAIADGISSSDVSQIASETAIKGFIQDYYSTSDAWSVKNSVQRVLKATNSWLYAQTRNSPYRYNKESLQSHKLKSNRMFVHLSHKRATAPTDTIKTKAIFAPLVRLFLSRTRHISFIVAIHAFFSLLITTWSNSPKIIVTLFRHKQAT